VTADAAFYEWMAAAAVEAREARPLRLEHRCSKLGIVVEYWGGTATGITPGIDGFELSASFAFCAVWLHCGRSGGQIADDETAAMLPSAPETDGCGDRP
jgi:hypothetical protein